MTRSAQNTSSSATPAINSAPASVFSFVRANDRNRVFAVFSFSGDQQRVTFEGDLYPGDYRDFATGDEITLGSDLVFDLPAWSYRVFSR